MQSEKRQATGEDLSLTGASGIQEGLDFAPRLRAERQRLRLTLAEFAARGGVAKTTQSSYERGERTPSIDYLRRLYDDGIDAWYILTGNTSSELGLRCFQGDLLEAIVVAIELWSLEREQEAPPELKAELVRLFYEQFAKGSGFDGQHLNKMLRLVK